MKKPILILLIGLIMLSTIAFAQSTVVETGASPKNGFRYGLKKFFENVDLMLTFNKEKKLEKMLFYAEVRQKEISELGVDNVLIDRVQADYTNKMVRVEEQINNPEIGSMVRERVRTHVLEMQQKHVGVLELVKVKLEAKGVPTPGIDNAILHSQQKLHSPRGD